MLNRSSFFLAIAILVGICSSPASGQEKAPSVNNISDKISGALKKSSGVMKQYSWFERTDVTREGKVVDILIEEFGWGRDGNPVRKVVNDQEASLPSSFIAHHFAEEVKAKLVGFMTDLRGFLREYAMEDEVKRASFLARASVSPPDAAGQILISAEDVLVKGDRLLWWVDQNDFFVTKASVSTLFQGDQVEFTTTNKLLPPGFQTMAFAEILVPAKSTMVQLHFYDFARLEKQ